ncbi:DUF427 domain-containing protein [Novosphingobium sp.]|uniref:DUF427 domain-containing protein n=1 Tax=Novosphingobium sp. TaxID=1874826 RepID=UPI003D10406A
MTPVPDPPRPGQESVWRYPRPAIAELSPRHIRVMHGGMVVADTRHAVRTLETSHPPSYYLPPDDITPRVLQPSARRSFCEWKGHAVYHDLVIGDRRLKDIAWSYPDPTRAFRLLRDHVAFYAGPLDLCTVDGQQVVAQSGQFYGGWITPDVAGPFKGEPGSQWW